MKVAQKSDIDRKELKVSLWCVFMLFAFTAHSQDPIPEFVQNNIDHLEEVKEKISDAQNQKDIMLEVEWTEHMIHDMLIYFSDNAAAYEKALNLEELVAANPETRKHENEDRRNMTMGMLLRNQYRYKEAIPYFKEAARVSREQKDELVFKDAMVHVGECHSRLHQDSTAVSHFHQAIDEIKLLNWEGADISMLLSRQYEYLGKHYFENEKFDTALIWTRKSLRGNSLPNQLASKYLLMAEIMLDNNDPPDSVVHYGHKALKICLEGGFRREELQAYDMLRWGFERKKQYDSGFFYF